MPYQVQQIIEGKSFPVCVTRDETVARALTLMLENNYSQLPVIENVNGIDIPRGMITYEGVLRALQNFDAKIPKLRVREVMGRPALCSVEDEIRDILKHLSDSNAVLVTNGQTSGLVGILTGYDIAYYFHNLTEDLLGVQEVEEMLKEFIQAAYLESDRLNEAKLNSAIERISNNPNRPGGQPNRKKSFDELSLGEYITLLVMKDSWFLFEPFFDVQREYVIKLLDAIRETRNDLAHLRPNITAEQRSSVKFAVAWLRRCQAEPQAKRALATLRKAEDPFAPDPILIEPTDLQVVAQQLNMPLADRAKPAEYTVTEAATDGGRWSVFADWLQSKPGNIDNVILPFDVIEDIIAAKLPSSARLYRAWWANDAVGHIQSQQWLAAGWRVSYINLTDGRVTFIRIRERERAYITFFSVLLDELRKTDKMPVRDLSPDGVSWIVVHALPLRGGQNGLFGFSFTRDQRLRVELYLDLGDQAQTKQAFDTLAAQKTMLEAKTGPISWERLDNRRASRIAQYHQGQITDEANQPALCRWAVETMIKFYGALVEPADKAILDAKQV